MTIGKKGDLDAFNVMRNLRTKVAQRFEMQEKDLELSMGMSGDYEQAVS